MDMRNVSAYCDYFLVISANNSRQIKAISDEIEERLEDEGVRLWHSEGGRDAKWVLLDLAIAWCTCLSRMPEDSMIWKVYGAMCLRKN